MRSIYEFTSYRDYLRFWISTQGSRSHGQKGRIAQALGVSSSFFSQVLKGEKTLSQDQASDLVDYLALSEAESEFLHILVEADRAGNQRYRNKLQRKIIALQEQAQRIGKRVPRHEELTDGQMAIYYSSWLYTGVRNLTAVPGLNNVDAIAHHLRLEPSLIQRILRFLIENGLCRIEGGKITYGPSSTHVDHESPFVNKHHQNWRLQAIQHMERKRKDDAFFTSPMSLSEEAANEIRKLLLTFIETVMKRAGPSPSEVTSCLIIDWFKF